MTRLLAAALLLVLAGCVAVEAVRPSVTAAIETTPPGFDITMPAPQEPLDTTPTTAVETVGAAHDE